MALSSKERVQLIQKGNVLFYREKYTLAERIFRTAKYQDGLIRLGQYYFNQKNYFRSAELFRLANNLKGEYACYQKMGLMPNITDFKNREEVEKANQKLNKNLAKLVQKVMHEQ